MGYSDIRARKAHKDAANKPQEAPAKVEVHCAPPEPATPPMPVPPPQQTILIEKTSKPLKKSLVRGWVSLILCLFIGMPIVAASEAAAEDKGEMSAASIIVHVIVILWFWCSIGSLIRTRIKIWWNHG